MVIKSSSVIFSNSGMLSCLSVIATSAPLAAKEIIQLPQNYQLKISTTPYGKDTATEANDIILAADGSSLDCQPRHDVDNKPTAVGMDEQSSLYAIQYSGGIYGLSK